VAQITVVKEKSRAPDIIYEIGEAGAGATMLAAARIPQLMSIEWSHGQFAKPMVCNIEDERFR